MTHSLHRRFVVLLAAALCAGLVACGGDDNDDGTSEADRADDPQPTASAQMQAVLDELAALGAKNVENLTTEQARAQPSVADAVRSLLIKRGQPTNPEPVGSVEDRLIAGPGGPLAIRIYKPAGAGPFPLVLYIHGGGWVIATIDTYDASARALTNAAEAIVVSTEYRKGPEFRYPAAHDDTFAAYQWTLANAASIGGIASKVAVAGESAGGNMAASIALRARDTGIQLPVHQLLIYPVVDATLDSPSEQQNRNAMPLSTASLAWFTERYLNSPADGSDPRFSVLLAPSLANLPSATIITADIDPLRSEGRFYAERLRQFDVPVFGINFGGVTHEFFGTAAVVGAARDAQALAGRELCTAFERAR